LPPTDRVSPLPTLFAEPGPRQDPAKPQKFRDLELID
jgi:hypothetical protein